MIMFYFIIKLAAAGYVLSQFWKFLFGERARRVWTKIFSHEKPRTIPTPDDDSIAAILGRTNMVILEEPRRAEPKPVGATDLEPTGFIGEEQPVTEDDIEPLEPPHITAEEEIDHPPPDSNDMSAGLSFRDLTDMVEVLMHETNNENQLARTAKTLYNAQGTEIMDFVTREICNADAVADLLKKCLDGNGFPLRKPRLTDFEISKYV